MKRMTSKITSAFVGALLIGHTYAIFNVVHRCYEIPTPS
jgi:hypothetical protein